MSSLTYFEAQKWASSFVSKHKIDKSTVDMLLLGMKDWNLTDLLLNYRVQMPVAEFERFKSMVEKVCQGWPPQYLLGEASFLGRKFKVTEDTLIPRQETAELVEWVLMDFKDEQRSLNVADIGTGTGIIGISLKLENPHWNVTLTDISSAALSVADANARRYKLNTKNVCSDLFLALDERFDVIVSNPPYIAAAEKSLMDKSVITYEPHVALFAAEEGLHVYRRMAAEIEPYLKAEAVLYLEIGFQQGQAVKQIFQDAFPNADVFLRSDITGHDRMIKVVFHNS
ncbi:methylase of polypeptide chain release factors [Liquorilactobacillus sucicola DSM 21376 = JCM 15457]|uniref:Release factor glutamine methyltransferase n=1 Tax=Liquorilactobacillus sucicola DSM 21376 = JCM 15457 TaxID=1423806 RepID=A0A023CVW6_9LACO|nr:peptide chain release factor N(5)-glutamine methyltransferase [Liquorilactobacillus sucicola]KRN06122.1 peptide release factor-glutamine N5-methyltransferase [Liquorilactobacillus sucicola DSM 21376 = JCM 15457]GAJ26048.1 methylase of polypeptide chain release factors [Liquorilactobacillus sucicola DSM 21376 = JCM 15457]